MISLFYPIEHKKGPMSDSSTSFNFRVIFEDANILVLDKEAGLLSQGESRGDVNLVDQLRVHFGRHYVGLVHRLDRNTSGIMIVAKRTKAADRLSQQIQEGSLKRRYRCLVLGDITQKFKNKNFTLRHHLHKDESQNRVQVVEESHPRAQVAILHGQFLKTVCHQNQVISDLSIELETGRSHQIRVQLSFEGFPIVGDQKYSQTKIPQMAARPLLHSASIGFYHPIGEKNRMEFECPLPPDMLKFTTQAENIS